MAKPILIHLPHSSREIPADLRGDFLLDNSALEEEVLAMTDHFTDELFESPIADRLVFPVSRLVTDPERFRRDADEPMAAKGMGALYVRTRHGVEMRRIDNRDRLLRRFYDPHHRALEEWASQALEEHGRCLILDGHSFPDSPHPSDLNQQLPRPEVNVGTDSFHTPAWLREATVRRVEAQGWSVGLDWPYRGSISPASRYGVDNRVHSVMIEVNRRMYMNEQTGERSGGFGETKVQLEEALGDIFRFWLEAP